MTTEQEVEQETKKTLKELLSVIVRTEIIAQRRVYLHSVHQLGVSGYRLKEVFREVVADIQPSAEKAIDVLSDINFGLMIIEPDWSVAPGMVHLALLVRRWLDDLEIPAKIRHRFLLSKAILGIMLGKKDRELATTGKVPEAGCIPALAQYWIYLAGAWLARSRWQKNHEAPEEEIKMSHLYEVKAFIGAYRCQPFGEQQEGLKRVLMAECTTPDSSPELLGSAWCTLWGSTNDLGDITDTASATDERRATTEAPDKTPS